MFVSLTALIVSPTLARADSNPLAPSNLSLPKISGDLAVDGTLSSSTGSWSGSELLAYSYQWEHCQATCSSIPGATTATYAPTTGDLGQRLRVIVTASNSTDSASARSWLTIRVAPAGAQVQAGLLTQLVPPDPPLTIAIELQTRGYELPFKVLTPGRVVVDWYLGPHPNVTAPAGLILVASGAARFRRIHESQVKIKPTRRGRALIQQSSSLALTAVATFTPEQSLRVSAVSTFNFS